MPEQTLSKEKNKNPFIGSASDVATKPSNPEAIRHEPEFRYERKFLIEDLSQEQVESIIKIHPALFNEIYYERYINNIYLDSPNMKSYLDNVDGISERLKTRIRWYGDMQGFIQNPTLEFKIKSSYCIKKNSYTLEKFSIDDKLSSQIIKEVFENSNIPGNVKAEILSLTPVVMNRYLRKYFLSACGSFRLTIDSSMDFYKFNQLNNGFLPCTNHEHKNHIVVELKYPVEKDKEASKLAALFPFRMTKNSKYVNGIDSLF